MHPTNLCLRSQPAAGRLLPRNTSLSRPLPPFPVRCHSLVFSRCVASASPTTPSTTTGPAPKRTKKPALTLEHFLLRQRVLALYRTIVRGLHALPRESSQRTELRSYARAEFERHRDVNDAGKIRYLVSTGKTEFDGMQRYLGEMGARAVAGQ